MSKLQDPGSKMEQWVDKGPLTLVLKSGRVMQECYASGAFEHFYKFLGNGPEEHEVIALKYVLDVIVKGQ